MFLSFINATPGTAYAQDIGLLTGEWYALQQKPAEEIWRLVVNATQITVGLGRLFAMVWTIVSGALAKI